MDVPAAQVQILTSVGEHLQQLYWKYDHTLGLRVDYGFLYVVGQGGHLIVSPLEVCPNQCFGHNFWSDEWFLMNEDKPESSWFELFKANMQQSLGISTFWDVVEWKAERELIWIFNLNHRYGG